jgi:hypothetical protein
MFARSPKGLALARLVLAWVPRERLPQPLHRARKAFEGYSFHPTEFSATAAAKSDAPKGTLEVEQDVIDVHLNKAGVLELLRRNASHPNNK